MSKVPYPNYSVASGLNPPFAGHNAFQHVKAHVDGIILVSDEEMVQTVDLLFRHGLVVEPSGTAALTAVLTGRVSFPYPTDRFNFLAPNNVGSSFCTTLAG